VQTASHIVYNGTERLQIAKSGKTTRYSAEVRYTRSDAAGDNASARASFVQEALPSGTLEDRLDDDPDFLTILNQPFAIQLDAATLRDLRSLHGSVPFSAPSPITGGTLRGSLRRGPAGRVNGMKAVGVRFDASGAMQGPLPDRPEIAIDGMMRMDGVAYYAADGALLLSLQARLTITGSLRDQKNATPVRIVYLRTIRADDSVPSWSEARR
jgi:hypothetical protein